MDEQDILNELRKYRNQDLKYEEGYILGSMCTKPHPMARKISEMFFETNLGDPGLFKGTSKLEKEVVSMIGGILHNTNAFGYIISGGTEANLTAMRAFKNISKSKGKPQNIIIPETAHFSFDKAKDMMDLNVVRPPLTKYFTMDVKFIRDYIEDSKNEVSGIVGIAGCTELGSIDNICELSKIAVENDILLHVDAAFGGFVIPFLDDKYKLNGYNYDFDFSLNGVSSITIDPHKMGLAPISAGGILFRDNMFKKYLDVDAPYLTEKQQATIIGTRSGVGVASTWGIMKLLGIDGYKKLVNESMEKTTHLVKKAREYGFETAIDPVMNIVALKDENKHDTCMKLREENWYVSVCRCVDALRIVVMPHLEIEHIDGFLESLSNTKKY
ncbi:tyrosine decarboxylase/aspartate 1-decarboxylase [Methanococcus maripaludis]|uniref:Probable L-tyrosine/L-aspartate decarboxylase n=1 Tax=Methanococcus maripaludis TaxID=39152 RepID=A0A7J9SHG6_METMI|nr:tyrosine decarboxylase MfnA [Methanococcus maripaludis]MBA2853352.1 tyrosine decarboxylase/aspartate 1-decarboxylase [Methanococcus maripaludis]MBB6497634.1 tyrosine decarboxylase/aspartate 1-decarboxylase [Methanococcus maripaludis]